MRLIERAIYIGTAESVALLYDVHQATIRTLSEPIPPDVVIDRETAFALLKASREVAQWHLEWCELACKFQVAVWSNYSDKLALLGLQLKVFNAHHKLSDGFSVLQELRRKK